MRTMAEQLRENLGELLKERAFISLYEFRILSENQIGHRLRYDLILSSILGSPYTLDLQTRTIYKG